MRKRDRRKTKRVKAREGGGNDSRATFSKIIFGLGKQTLKPGAVGWAVDIKFLVKVVGVSIH
jgi:hypothetical protein